MPRQLSAAAKTYTGPMVWIADITTRAGAKHYFAEDALSFSGNTYLPYLRIASPPRFTRTLQADAGEIELLNTDLVVGDLLQVEDFSAPGGSTSGWEGALCELKQLLRGIDEAVLILRGRLTEQVETDHGVAFRLLSELDPAQIELHARLYAQLCTWRFSQPARLTPCGYNPVAANDVSEAGWGERAANIFSSTTIGDSTLAENPDAHVDRIVVITAGTGRGQKRRIRSNTATTFTLYHKWGTPPDASSRFRVFTLPAGAPKPLFSATSALLETTATAGGTNFIEDTGLAMTIDEHKDDRLRIIAGSGAGQQRKIGSNTATRLTLASGEADFNPLPDATSVFRVLYARCPKDFAPSCEDRARTQAFNGFPTLVPLMRRIFSGVRGGGIGLLGPVDEGDLQPRAGPRLNF